jgi:hypothetical protein
MIAVSWEAISWEAMGAMPSLAEADAVIAMADAKTANPIRQMRFILLLQIA